MGPRIRGVAPIGPRAPAFGGWPRLDPVEVEFFVHRGRLSRDSRGWPHWGRGLGSQLGGWPQSGRLWRPRLGKHMLALSDLAHSDGHVPETRPGDPFRGWPSLGLRIRGAQSGGGPDWILLALSDGRSQAGTYRRHVPGTRSGGGPHWGPAIGGVAPIGSGSVGPRPVASGRLSRVTPVRPRVVSSPGQPHLGAL